MIRVVEWVLTLGTLGLILSIVMPATSIPLKVALGIAAGALALGTALTYYIDRWIKGWDSASKTEPGHCVACNKPESMTINGYEFCSWECVPREWIGGV